ncbi:hypothetical protein R3W88_004325 [Solanum pinnatisectum]|uniref:Uncharacterized protein n=1 Tax=Solanum pinnatisectum TaxID=50273 RepID=A0AAV9KCK7_9SOLN|nr:hypothetical protein R3W88_004325 [Solanum pinnatisectum]
MASSSLSLNSPKIFTNKNYQIWPVRIKSYFETDVICDVVMEEKPFQPFLANPTKVHFKALSDKLLYKTMPWEVFLRHKIKRRKRKTKKFCKFKNKEKNPTSTTKAEIEEEHFFNCSNKSKGGVLKFAFSYCNSFYQNKLSGLR